ncbi:C-GCAxxG-C-C family protein [uncultured Merdimonas sp.]|uniref:C-GCAxxG-C-C family protein n=1 Tax=uncultured Merdimonas sp. TaxID=2023269 RepID=UPI00320970D0
MKKEEIRQLFIQGIDCSQVVAGHFAQEMGMTTEEARKVSACFGGGMMCGETCGAVTGALMVIGMKYGHCKEGDLEQKNIMMAKVAEFKKHFHKKYPSCMCKDLLGHDVGQPGELEKVLEEGLMMDFCPHVVNAAIDALEQVL